MNELDMAPLATDPVCGMQVSPEVAEAQGLTSEHDGSTYHFCSKGCKLNFDEDPARVFAADYTPSM
jgi:YHS domain-containing protein